MGLESIVLSPLASSLSMIRRRFLATALAGLTIPAAARAMTWPSPPRDARNPTLVVESPATSSMAPHFRTFDDIAAAAKARGLDTTGLDDLPAVSGGGQFSTTAWRRLRNSSVRLTGIFTVMDLRQESHGFLDSHAVGWLAQNNWVNVGMTREQVLASEMRRLTDLSRQHHVSPPTLQDFRHRGIKKGPELTVQHVVGEAIVVSQTDARYIRFTVTDHLRPTDADVDRFVILVLSRMRQLNGPPVYIHCHDGGGRTTTFLAMIDMLANADRVALDGIIARQAAVTPFHNLADLQLQNGQDGPLTPYYRERLAFLARFHAFSVARLGGERRRWSRWLADGGA